eukprot:gnl/Chilomastix_caulleri/1755.p2 GENE.gnl/Chilomastix_caulleri/1755~~gnl/Chilomastix_caulleri/1755.p2  ORF type:complete len:68 (+),score=10.97 gnl/Chilomastix_caulleri/1755:43-246(+)
MRGLLMQSNKNMLGSVETLKGTTKATHEMLEEHNRKLSGVSEKLHIASDSLTAVNGKLDDLLKNMGE